MSEPNPRSDAASAVAIGRVAGVHGIRGEIKVEPLTDFPERFNAGATFWIDLRQYTIDKSRWQKRLVYLKLQGIDDRNAAETLRERELTVPELRDLSADEGIFYQHDIIGLRVEDTAGEALGKVASIFTTGANDVYVVRGPRGELLLPAIDDVIKTIDPPAGRIVVDLLPGLEFAPAGGASHTPARPRPRPATKRETPSTRS